MIPSVTRTSTIARLLMRKVKTESSDEERVGDSNLDMEHHYESRARLLTGY